MSLDALLLPSPPASLATLVVAAIAAVSIMAGSLIVLADAPARAAHEPLLAASAVLAAPACGAASFQHGDCR